MKFLLIFALAIFLNAAPSQWGEKVSGVAYKFKTDKKEIALTFDACGGSAKSNQVDFELFDFLIKNNIKATIFVSSKWIDANEKVFLELSKNNILQFENHGTRHIPLSTTGLYAYKIAGTKCHLEVKEEIEQNQKKMEKLLSSKPAFFRAGTAFYDEEAVQIAKKMGVTIAGFSIVGDAGATLSKQEIINRLKTAKSGDIIIGHINHPQSASAEGFIFGIKYLKSHGFSFVSLNDVKNNLIEAQ